jgi:hypothetical protein
VLVPITAAACLLAGIVGAFAGFCAEIHWPLSEPNSAYTLRRGVAAGLLGAVAATAILVTGRREHLWWLAVVAAGLTLLLSSACMWWHVVSNLG